MSALGKTVAFAAAVLVALCAETGVAQIAPSAFTGGTRYDLQGRIVGTIAPDPNGTANHFPAVRNRYNAAGQLLSVEKGELSSWQPDDVLPKNWSVFNLFSRVDMTYDAVGRKLKEVLTGRDSGSGLETVFSVTQYSYDLYGRPECTAIRMNPAVYASLPASACTLGTTGTNGPDRITRQVYDVAGQLLKVQKAYGVTTANGFPATLQQDYATYTYTNNGKQASVTDANGNKSAYGYDGFDRQTLWAFPNPTTPGVASTTDFEQYDYDANGNRTLLRKRDGRTLTYSYDALNRMTVKTVAGACVSGYACTTPPSWAARNVYYAYDLRGLQTAARFDSATGADAVVNGYDGFGRMTSSTASMGGVSRAVGQSYDANGNRIRVTHPDGTYFTYDYDGLDRLIAVRQNGAVQIASNAYTARGQRASSARGAVLTSYTYDDVSRLSTQADDLSGTAYDYSARFAYNPASQITTYTRGSDAYAYNAYTPATTAYAVNGLNQYTAVGAGALGYDSNGNLATNGTSSFTYDVENRLVVSAGALATTMVYDPLGRLIQTSGASGTVQFLYDGDERIAEYNGGGVLQRRYVHGPGEDDPLIWYEGAGLADLRSLQSDHQGSIVSAANAAGAMLAIRSYDEYGVPSGGDVGAFQYTGQAWLPDLGMYYYKARIYSSKLGRFLQTDPIGYKDQMDLYAYVGNDPIDGRDPTGSQQDPGDMLANAILNAPAAFVDTMNSIGRVFVGIHSSDPAERPTARDYVNVAMVVVAIPAPEARVAAVSDAARAAEAAGSVARAGRYEFPDQAAGGTPYVGQSGNIPSRLEQHAKAGRYEPGTARTTAVPGGRTAREISEHQRIQQITGGVPARQSDAVSNKVDPIGPNRRHLLPPGD